jgi:hypothetical protein
MRTLASIIKAPRRIARDTLEKFAPAEEYFTDGIDTLGAWLGDNIGDDDLVSLAETIRLILHRRVQEQVTGAMDSRATTGFASRYPTARNIKRIV